MGPGQVGPPQAEPGRAFEDSPPREHAPGGGPGRGRGLPGVGRPRGLRGRRPGALPGHRLRPRAIRPRAGPRRGEAGVRRPQPRRRLLEGEPPGVHPPPVAPPARLPEAGGPRRLAPEAEDAPLGRRHPGHEEPVRRDAGRGLRLAQERPAPRRHPRLDPRHQRGRGAGPGDRRRDRRHGGGRADHGHPPARRGPRDGDEPPRGRRHGRPADGDRPRPGRLPRGGLGATRPGRRGPRPTARRAGRPPRPAVSRSSTTRASLTCAKDDPIRRAGLALPSGFGRASPALQDEKHQIQTSDERPTSGRERDEL